MKALVVLCFAFLGLVGVVYAEADLAVSNSDAQDPVTLGANVVYAIFLINNGPAAANNVVLSDSLPPNVTFVSFEAPETWTCTTPQSDTAGALNCSCAKVEAGETVAFSLNVKPNAAGVLTNTVAVTTTEPDQNLENNSRSEETTVLSAQDPHLDSE